MPTELWGASLNLRLFFPLTLSKTATVVSTKLLTRISVMGTQAVSLNKALSIELESRLSVSEVSALLPALAPPNTALSDTACYYCSK